MNNTTCIQRKNGLTSLSALGLMMLAGVAHAQSNVTIYGLVDAGMSYNSNAKGPKLYALTSGNENGAKWGLRGVEDLGSGAQAIFTLESGYSVTTGAMAQNGTFFGRQLFVGIASPNGTVTLGRQYSTASSAVGPFSAGGNWAATGAAYGAHPGDVDNLDASNRINNAIKYQSVSYNGVTFGALYSFGEIAGSMSRNQIYDANLAYTNGPFAAAVGYVNAKNPNFSFFGNKVNDSSSGINISSPAIAGYASAGSQQILTAGASYTLGAAVLGMEYSNVKFSNLGATSVAGLNTTEAAYRGSASLDIAEANLMYAMTPMLQLGVSYSITDDHGASGSMGARYRQVDLGAIYSLSKMTSLYLIGVYQKASGTNSTGTVAVAAINGATPSASDRQMVSTFGIVHKF